MKKSKLILFAAFLLPAFLLTACTTRQESPAQEEAPQAQETAPPQAASEIPEEELDNGSGAVGAGLATAVIGIIFVVVLLFAFSRTDKDNPTQT